MSKVADIAARRINFCQQLRASLVGGCRFAHRNDGLGRYNAAIKHLARIGRFFSHHVDHRWNLFGLKPIFKPRG